MKLKHRKIGGFILILAGSAILWFVSRYKDVYQDIATVNVQWVNVPKKIILDSQRETTLFNAFVKDRGFTLLWHQFDSYDIELDFVKFTFERNDSIFFNPSVLLDNINEQSTGINIVRTSKSDVFIPVKRVKRKKVALIKGFEVVYSSNFQPIEILGFTPDSVTIYGNEKELEKVKHLSITSKTVEVKDSLTIIDFNLSAQFDKLKFDQASVSYKIRSAEMTEGMVSIPIELLNVPQSSVVKLLPENVTITYSTTVEDFENISELDFRATIDYKSLDGNNVSINPDIKLLSPKIKGYRMREKIVQVLTIL
jgi:hypothetical protein